MNDGSLAIDRLGALASGPIRMRAELDRATRRVRALPARAGALGAVAAPLPVALFGAELLDVLSERLRALLAPPERVRAVTAAPPARAPVGFTPARGKPATFAEPPPDRAAPPLGTDAPHVASGLAAAAVTEREAAARHATAGAPPAALVAPRARARVPRAALAERVRGYWTAVEPSSGERAHALPEGSAPIPVAARSPMGPAGNGRARTAPLPDGQVAGALRAFVAGEPFPPAVARAPRDADLASLRSSSTPHDASAPWPGAGDRPTAVAAGPPAATVLPRPGAAGEAPSRAAALRDLADDVAEIVREQAISHGIDVP